MKVYYTERFNAIWYVEDNYLHMGQLVLFQLQPGYIKELLAEFNCIKIGVL